MTKQQGKLKVGLVTALGLATLLAGCGHQNTAATSGGGTTVPTGGGAGAMQIAVVPKGTSHEYWKSIHAGALKAQQELQSQGTNVNVIWKGPESEGDRNAQVNIVEGFITQGVKGIVLAPLDSEALVHPVQEATSQKIPVVIIDSSLNGTDWSSFVATDNEKGGQAAGMELGNLLGGKGRVLVLPYALGSASTEAREKGFQEAISKFPGITVLSSNQYGGPTTDTAYKTSQNLLARYGTQTDGVFASNETNTRGMLLGLKDAGLLKKVKFVGFDAADDLIAALKAGNIQGLIAQDPFKMGYTGVKNVVAVIQGKPVQKDVDTGAALITADNVNSPNKQEFVNPPIDQYLKGQ